MEDKLESAGDEFKISKIVKIWDVKYSRQPTTKPPYSKKEGPFFGLGKIESQRLHKEIMNDLVDLVDLNKPDREIYVSPKYVPELQQCKFGGK